MDLKAVSLKGLELQNMVRIYYEVWGGNPNDFLERFKRHTTYPGFKGVVVYDGKDVLGFAYGYSSIPGQFYHDLLRMELTNSNQEWWLEDCFEFVELVVHPNYRRKNIGQELATNLLENSKKKTAVLTTQTDNISARNLYKKLNWKIIKENFYPGDTTEPYVIMGKILNL
jgi:ribosomal protein S18 acetylase RimI-like enzyme